MGVEHSSEGIYGCHSHNAKLFDRIEHSGIRLDINVKTNESYYLMFYYSWAEVVRLLAEGYDTKLNVKLGGFRSQLQALNVSSQIEELWYNETVYRWTTIYIYMQ